MQAPPRKAHDFDSAMAMLAIELDTSWMPDPWSWVSMECGLAGSSSLAVTRFAVPLVDKIGVEIPLLGDHAQVVLATAALEASEHWTPAPEVFGYVPRNGSIRHYRSELAAKVKLERRLAESSAAVIQIDVKQFFRSIRSDVLVSQLGDRAGAEVLSLLEAVQNQFGYSLPEGYYSSRLLSNIVLSPVDDALRAKGVGFTRWLDDYRIFVSSMAAADRTISLLDKSLGRIGLERSLPKSFVVATSSFDPFERVSVAGHEDLGDAPEYLSSERKLRFQLRQAAETGDRSILAELPQVLPASAAPRLAEVLASSSWSSADVSLVKALLARSLDGLSGWWAGRLAYALWSAPSEMVVHLADHLEAAYREVAGVRPIIARVLARHQPARIRPLMDLLATDRHRALVEAESAGQLLDAPPTASFL